MSTNELLGRGRRGGGVETGDEGGKEEKAVKGVKDALEAMVLIGCQARFSFLLSISSSLPPCPLSLLALRLPHPHASTSPPPSSPSVSVTHKRCLNLCHLSSACFLSVLLLLFLCHSVCSVCSTGLMSGLPLISRARSAGRDERMIAAGRSQTPNDFI